VLVEQADELLFLLCGESWMVAQLHTSDWFGGEAFIMWQGCCAVGQCHFQSARRQRGRCWVVMQIRVAQCEEGSGSARQGGTDWDSCKMIWIGRVWAVFEGIGQGVHHGSPIPKCCAGKQKMDAGADILDHIKSSGSWGVSSCSSARSRMDGGEDRLIHTAQGFVCLSPR
jgi:hypothetical protein